MRTRSAGTGKESEEGAAPMSETGALLDTVSACHAETLRTLK